jgi:pseudouridine synthase
LRDASNPITVDSGFSLASTLPSSGFESTGSSVAFTEPGTLAPGATVTLTFNVRIRPGSASPLINQGTVNFQGDNGNPVLTDASDSTNPTAPGSGVNPGNPNPLNPDGSGGNVNQPNAGNADPTIINLVSPVTPTGTKSVRLVTDSDGSGSVTTGDTLEYTITYSNPTASDINNFLVTDSIDSNGLSFVSGSYSLSATGTGTTVAANPNYNGTTDTNLNRPGTLGRGGGQVVIKYRAVVTAAEGTEIRNQARATSSGGNVNPSLTDALQKPGDLPQLLDDGIDQGNIPGNTGDDDPTVLRVGGSRGPLRPVANKSVRFLRDNDRSDNLTIGDDIEYKIVVQNRNAVPITNLTVSDAIPFQWLVLRDASNPITVDSGFSLASPPALPSSSFVSTGNTVTFTNPGTLAPGATMTLTFNVRIRPGSPSPLINQGTINFQGDNGNPVLTDASDSTNPTGPGSDVNPGNPSPLNPDGSGGNVNQPNAGNADPTIINIVSPITPTGTKSVRLVTDADGSGAVTTGDTLEYTITYSNTSSSDVRDFLAIDSIDSNGLRFVSGSYSLSATGTGTTVAANPNYNGTTDTNLNTPGTLGRGGGQVVIKYRAVVLAAAGTKINNQARATSNVHRYLLFYKPYDVLSQFTDKDASKNHRGTLKDYIPVPSVYPVGRLDQDSEGLLLLTNNGRLQHRLSDRRFRHPRTYWVQVERIPDEAALNQLRRGVVIQNYCTRPALVQLLSDGTPPTASPATNTLS